MIRKKEDDENINKLPALLKRTNLVTSSGWRAAYSDAIKPKRWNIDQC